MKIDKMVGRDVEEGGGGVERERWDAWMYLAMYPVRGAVGVLGGVQAPRVCEGN